MATTSVSVDDTAYVEVSVVDGLLQNSSAYPVRIVFAASLPAVDATPFHTLLPTQALLKSNDLPTGNVYARCDQEGKTAKVVFSN